MTGPVGLFDSGVGGLTVVAEVFRRLPNEKVIYIADSAHVPYGERQLEEIQEFALGITDYLIKQGAKAVVMACNMSTAVALELAVKTFPNIPILGTIGAGSRAAVATGSNTIGILATTGTVRSNAYPKGIHKLNPDAKVIQQACPAFVPIIEAGRTDSEEAEIAVRNYVEPLIAEGVETIVLGCTHYPFLRQLIEKTAPGVEIVDPAEETVTDLYNTLSERNELAGPNEPGEHRFIASAENSGLEQFGRIALGRKIDGVEHAIWGEDLFPWTSPAPTTG